MHILWIHFAEFLQIIYVSFILFINIFINNFNYVVLVINTVLIIYILKIHQICVRVLILT